MNERSHRTCSTSSRRDTATGCCKDCGTYFELTEHEEGKTSTSWCPSCLPNKEYISDRLVAGTWYIRDDDTRDLLIEVIRSETPYEVYVADRVSEVYVYEPVDSCPAGE